MTQHEEKHEEERPRESYPNPTQERIDREGVSDAPVDVSWEEERWGERRDEPPGEDVEAAKEWPETVDQPHEGEEGQRKEV